MKTNLISKLVLRDSVEIILNYVCIGLIKEESLTVEAFYAADYHIYHETQKYLEKKINGR